MTFGIPKIDGSTSDSSIVARFHFIHNTYLKNLFNYFTIKYNTSIEQEVVSVEEKRCPWAIGEYNIAYHDTQWGKIEHQDQVLFEFLILEGMQAGLSWLTILKKRENFAKAFDQFDVEKVANYTEEKIQELLQDEGIIRNRLKVRGAVKNAQAFLRIQQEFGSFDAYIWGFVDGKQIVHTYEKQEELPTHSPLSDTISKDLKKRGFTFVGTTIIYSYLQAIGIINDHMVWCKEYHNCQ